MPKEKFPSGVVVHMHEKGWMDDAGMHVWLDKCWARQPGGGPQHTAAGNFNRPALTTVTQWVKTA